MTNEEAIDQLSGLISVCKDGERGYREAAETVSNAQVRSIFNEYEKQRAHFVRDLQTEVEGLGGNPPDHGSMSAVFHRGWMDLKSVLSGGDAGALIAACESGEDAALTAFERVANKDISGHTRTVVETQWRKIQEARQHMLRLKTEMSSGAESPMNE